MCLIVFGWALPGRHPIVIAGNRDEFHARPTRSAHWSDDDRVLCGRDLVAGGTWMGVTRCGRFAALTNHRDPAAAKEDAPTCGTICDGVLADEPLGEAMDVVVRDASRYNGFNVIAGEWDNDGRRGGLHFVAGHGSVRRERVDGGIHGLSNASLDTPWPKVTHAKKRLAESVADDPDSHVLAERLFALLADETVATDDELPSTGVAHNLERALSAAFIRLPGYGTRSSTVLLVNDRGGVTFVERRCEPGRAQESRFAFATDDRRFGINAVRAS